MVESVFTATAKRNLKLYNITKFFCYSLSLSLSFPLFHTFHFPFQRITRCLRSYHRFVFDCYYSFRYLLLLFLFCYFILLLLLLSSFIVFMSLVLMSNMYWQPLVFVIVSQIFFLFVCNCCCCFRCCWKLVLYLFPWLRTITLKGKGNMDIFVAYNSNNNNLLIFSFLHSRLHSYWELLL